MKADLATYLHDHLAGADLAVELLERLAKVETDPLTAALAASILVEVTQDRETLQRFAAEVGTGSASVKAAAALLIEKALRLKLRVDEDDPFGRFETLELVALGALGKAHLWRALQTGPQAHVEAAGLDLEELIARAESQHARLEERRLQLAAVALQV